MSARDRIHAMFPLDEAATAELDKRLDAHRAEVLAEADLLPKADVVAWLTKKAREGTPVWLLASKAARGAIRPDNLRMLPADFFEPDHVYVREHHGCRIEFHVRHVDVTPNGTRFAFGFRTEPCISGWAPMDSDDMDGWTDVTEAGAS